ncbi:hypothetical protein [Campylobacter ureolyticus]|uniref:hypothetical protein n=1 Tax=Campylobacter ureolyticus TaxID=827 RepID=UPI00291363A7|nr:hypothetical protein [Campylobacter ureolyticus]MDU5326636.1 hypothetical protein [Campylobacter ureolyticus]
MSYKKYILYLTTMLIVTFLSSYFYIFLKISNYNEPRVYNLRKIDDKYRSSLMKYYIDKNYKKNSILILGDSQANGVNFTYNSTFGAILGKKLNKNVFVLALQDARILDNLLISNYLNSKNYKFDAVIFDVNQGHTQELYVRRLLEYSSDWRISVLANQKSFFDFVQNLNPKSDSNQKPLEKYELKHMGNGGHIVKNENIYFEQLQEFTNSLKLITDKIIFYVTPRPWDNFDFSTTQNGKEKIINFNNKVLNFCKKNGIICIIPKIYSNKYYIDIVHFNKLGHEKLAEILSQTINNQ